MPHLLVLLDHVVKVVLGKDDNVLFIHMGAIVATVSLHEGRGKGGAEHQRQQRTRNLQHDINFDDVACSPIVVVESSKRKKTRVSCGRSAPRQLPVQCAQWARPSHTHTVAVQGPDQIDLQVSPWDITHDSRASGRRTAANLLQLVPAEPFDHLSKERRRQPNVQTSEVGGAASATSPRSVSPKVLFCSKGDAERITRGEKTNGKLYSDLTLRIYRPRPVATV